MFLQNLQARIAIIVVVLIGSIILLYPSVGPIPEWWDKYIPAKPIRLGLDLQGGLHLILEVQTEKSLEVSIDQTMGAAQDMMKENGIRYKDVKSDSPTTFTVYLKDASQEPLFDAKVLPELLNFKKVSSGPGEEWYEVKLGLDPKMVENLKEQSVRQAVETIRNRVDAFGLAEPDVVRHGEDRIVVQLPGLKEDVESAIRIIKQTARLEFKIVDGKGDLTAALKGRIPDGDEILYKTDRNPQTGAITRTPFLLKKQILMTGDVLTKAHVSYERTGRPYIGMEFNSRGSRIFQRITRDNVGERLAIILDDRVYSAPVIKSEISGGAAVIEGMFSPEEASELALVLNSGSLPAPVRIEERRSVGPSLGEDSIRLGRNAVIFGLAMVVVCMGIYYKWCGMVANTALVLNLFLIFAVMVLPKVRAALTLPGVAGVALTMGMAIDANILIFERIREELRRGKSPRAAMQTGYERAFGTIFDSNLTTILAALPLIQFGTGPIKGFGITLCIGLTVSMFTSLFVTRTIFEVVFDRTRIKRLSI